MKQPERKTHAWFSVDMEHIGALDGIRALGVLTVLWFHFWQQSWLMPVYQTPFLQWLGIERIYPDMFRRCGYLCVDLMLLLSAFVLYLPYARNAFLNTPIEDKKTFFRKRFARIVPSYVLVILVTFSVSSFEGFYRGRTGFAFKDLISHLTFTEMLFPDTYLFSGTSGVLWTVCIEVGLYLIFPWLAKAFRRYPLFVYACMLGAGAAFTYGVALRVSEPRFMVNRFLTFLPVFANGMMAAHLYTQYAVKVRRKTIPSIAGALMFIGAAVLLVKLFSMCAAQGPAQQTWQMNWRIVLSFVFAAFVLGGAISPKPVRKLLDNRVLAAIAAVSYNLYLWHQWLMVRLRMSFGANSGADIAAMGADTQWTLTLIALGTALIVAAVVTYGFERPVSGLILHSRKETKHARNKQNEQRLLDEDRL